MALRQEIFEVTAPHRIDSDAMNPPGRSTPTLNKDLTAQDFREIGKILLDAEQTYLCVGIPLLPSCIQLDAGRVSKLPLDDFLQQSLVTINTPTLLLYAKELEATPAEVSVETLQIQLANHKRYFFPIITMVTSALLTLTFLLTCGFSNEMATILALFFAASASYIACETVRDSYRRISFQKTLEIELQRRHGRGGTTTTTAMTLNPLCE